MTENNVLSNFSHWLAELSKTMTSLFGSVNITVDPI